MNDIGQNTQIKSTNTRNTLQREGILPSNNRFSKSSNFKQNDQEKLPQQPIKRGSMIISRRLMNTTDLVPWESYFLPKSHWISLDSNETWWQITPNDSGHTNKCGLHSIIESNGFNKLFISLYQPMTIEAISSCVETSKPFYNFEVNAKIINETTKLMNKSMNTNFQIIFAFKSISDYMLITCSLLEQNWILSKVINGEETIISEYIDDNIKSNVFFNLLIQVRDNTLSIDVNATPLFTLFKFTDGSQLSGLFGVQAKVSFTVLCTEYQHK